MHCTACGNALGESDRYCGQCGKANAPGQGSARPPDSRPRGLYLIKSDKKIAGVCAGIARYLDWDVTLVRVAFLAGLLVHGAGLLAYVVLWIAMPRDTDQSMRTAAMA